MISFKMPLSKRLLSASSSHLTNNKYFDESGLGKRSNSMNEQAIQNIEAPN